MSEKIDDIIDEKAFQQLERLLRDLGIAQAKFVDLATSAASMNAELGKVQGFRELESAISKTTAATEKMQEQGRKVEDTLQKTAKAEKELVEATKGRLLGVQEETKLLNSLSGSLDQNIRNQIRLKAELKAIQEEQKKLNEQQTTGVKMTGEMAERAAELAKSETELKTAIAANNLEIRRAAKEANAAKSSYEEMSSRLDRLRATYKALSAEERNNLEIGGALLASIQEYDAELKNIDKSMGVTNRNVGNYSESVTEAIEATGLFGKQIEFLRAAKERYAAGAKLATVSTNSFKAALIATGIGAILVLLGGLISFLMKSQRGIDLVSKALEYASAFVDVFVGALVKLGGQIFDNIIPALKGVWDILSGIATFDYQKIQQGLSGVANAVNNIDPIRLTDLAKAANEAGKEAIRLKELQVELEKQTTKSIVEQERLNKELDRFNSIADDNTRSFAERQAAAESALVVQQQLSNEQLKLAKAEETIVNARVAAAQKNGMVTREMEREQAEATAKRIKAEADFSKALFENTRKQREIKQDLLERDLDILIDGFDNQKTINEKKIADERLSLEERRRILEETKKLSDDSFAKQIETIQKFTNEKVNADELINESDATVMNQKIRSLGLSEIIEGRLLEIIRDRKSANSDLAEAEADLLEKEAAARLKAQEDQIKMITETSRKAVGLVEQQRDEELDALNQSFAAGEISQQEYNNRRIAIQREYTRRAIQEEIRGVEELMAVNRARGISVADQERQLAALKLRLSQETADAQIQDINRVAEEEQRLRDLKQQFAQEAGRLAISLVQSQFAAEEEKLKFSAAASEEQKNRELERINETVMSEEEKAVRISQVEQRAAREREAIELRSRQLRIRQAEFEKLANVAGIISNTALAIVKQLAATPLPAGFPLVATIGAIGAVQLGQALAVKIPRFEKGTKSAPGGLALTDERGAELYIEPSGNTFLGSDSGPTLRYLKKGTTVIPANETREIMAMSGLASVTGYGRDGKADTDKIVKAYEKGAAEIKKALLSKRQASTVINKSGIHYIYRTGNSYQEYLNRNL